MPSQTMSRRAFMPLAASAVLSPAIVTAARAQEANWQLYRPEGLGFEIEMPGKPEIQEDRADGWTSIDAEIDFDRMHFGVSRQEHKEGISVQQMSAAQRMAARQIGIEVTREAAITMDGFPGLEIVSESDEFSMVMRIVIVDKRTISATVTGNGGRLSENPSVRRFLGSFKLLPAAAPR